MKKITMLLMCILILSICTGMLCFAAAPDTSYKLLLNDEFNGTELNTDIWMYRSGSTNRNENVRVADGKLMIDYKKVDDNKTASSYTGGGVITKMDLPYGYYEVHAKSFNGAKGLHTSFWTAAQATNFPYYPKNNSCIEIDGFEIDSNNGDAALSPYYNLHYWWADHSTGGSARYDINTDNDVTTEDWFTMGFEYLPGKIVYYVNGEKVGENPLYVYNPANVWLTALAWTSNVDPAVIDDSKADENGLFGSSEYDYFRFYQKKLKGVNLLGNGHFELNRQTSSKMPRGFYYSGNAVASKTPFAHSGTHAASITGVASLGRFFPYLADGTYTFEGYFKSAEGTKARLAVYDKNDVLLKTVEIPYCADWTKVSLPDIAVTDSARVMIETESGSLMADDVSFFCQEGETGYENYEDTDYQKYSAIKTANSTKTLDYNAATYSTACSWAGTSTITGVSNRYTYAYTSSIIAALAGHSKNLYTNISASWTTTLPGDGTFDLEVWNIKYEDNVPSQVYTITLDGTTVGNAATLTTNASPQSGAWESIGTVTGTKGQTVTVNITPTKPTSNGQNFRVSSLRFVSDDDRIMENALITQIHNPIFQYQANPHAFDTTDTTLAPYRENDVVYIPYQAIKDKFTLNDVASDAKYVTVAQIAANGNYAVAIEGSHILIYEPKYTPSSTLFQTAKILYNQLGDNSISTARTAEYVGTSNMAYQEVFHVKDSATLSAGWGTSSLGSGGSKYNGNTAATADWAITPPYTGNYSLHFYSVAHAGNNDASPSTKQATVTVAMRGSNSSYTLDQCNGQTGWYDLGSFTFEKGEEIFVNLRNDAGFGILRACAVRLVPQFDPAEYYNNADHAEQEYYGSTTATKTGTWTEGDIISSEDASATLTYTFAPQKSQEYRVQIYVPASATDATTDAKVAFALNGELQKQFLFNQKTNSKAGWYTLDVVKLTEADTLSVDLSNLAGSGKLYAKGIRLIPFFETPVFVNDMDVFGQEYYGPNAAQKNGTWQDSTDDYIGCIFSPNPDATIEWTVTPSKNTRYSVQVYVPKYTASGTSSATTLLDINGVPTYFTLYQRADSEENTGNGWYDLGSFDLTTADTVTVNISNHALDGWLRAKAIRLVPESRMPVLVGNGNADEQELYGMSVAVKTGTWSGSSVGGSSYYGSDSDGVPATATWTITPSKAQPYSIQVYVPCIDQDSTTNSGYALLTVDGASHAFLLDQRKDDATYSGWYELDVLNLSKDSAITIEIGKYAGTYIRANAVRLVPYVSKATVNIDGTDTLVKSNEAESYYNNVRTVDENGNAIVVPTLLDALVAADKVSDIGIVPNLVLSDGTPSTLTLASMAISPDTYRSQNLDLTPGAGASYAELWSGAEVFVDSGKTVSMQVNVPEDGNYYLVLSGNHWDTGRNIKATVDGANYYSDAQGTNQSFILGGAQQAGVYKAQSANGIRLTAGYHTLTVVISGTTRLNYAGLVKADSQADAAAVQATFTTKEAFNAYMNQPIFDGTKISGINVAVNGKVVTDNFDRYLLSDGDEISFNIFDPITISDKFNGMSENIAYDGNRQLTDETFAQTNFIILLNKGTYESFPFDTSVKDSMRGLYLNGYVGFNQDNLATTGNETEVLNYINAQIVGNSIDTSGRLVIALNLPANVQTSFDGKTFINLNGALSESHYRNYGGYNITNLYITDSRNNGDSTVTAKYQDGKVVISSKKAQPIFVTVKNADGSIASVTNYALNFNAPIEVAVSAGQTVYVWEGTSYISSGTTALPLCPPLTIE